MSEWALLIDSLLKKKRVGRENHDKLVPRVQSSTPVFFNPKSKVKKNKIFQTFLFFRPKEKTRVGKNKIVQMGFTMLSLLVLGQLLYLVYPISLVYKLV